MEKAEAEKFVGKRVRIILGNSWSYNLNVIEVTADSIVGYDKFHLLTSIRLKEIFVLTEMGC